ncbi:uncharacterized tRNA/rRNA methyltransferase BB_0516-like [Ylistrum balloti]|uniref:uncharacterized tRNA/rRNA methyltransferase BB_0516-like n=1 Tax=Ylistrum balloti TaxID=509963 RepID=UPI002905A717|nr:uncharacterized tRNA/rRNA methyltransferase BB_0516-like [Ylistrum balloti]
MTISGTHAVIAALQNGIRGELYVYSKHQKIEELYTFAEKKICTIHPVTREYCKKHAIRQNIQLKIKNSPLTQVQKLSTWLQDTKDIDKLLVLIIDHIHDAQNLGAIFRSSALFSVDLLILPKRRVAPINDAGIRSASGAITLVPTCTVSNVHSALRELKDYGFWNYALDARGSSSYTAELSKRSAFILGNEAKGLHELVSRKSDFLLSIPSSGAVDSFNASVSLAIICYEYRRQHPLLQK